MAKRTRATHHVNCLCVVSFFLASAVAADCPPRFLNLDFEVASHPVYWYYIHSTVQKRIDSEVAHSGRRSLRIERAGESEETRLYSGAWQGLELPSARGGLVRLGGWVRTSGTRKGLAHLFVSPGPTGAPSVSEPVSDENAWTFRSVSLDFPPGSRWVYIGASLEEEGVAWFDSLSVTLDGAEFPQSSQPPALSDKQIGLLQASASPFQTTDPSAPAHDLEGFAKMVGDARILALGEASHGTHEFFEMKHRLIRFLVESRGFRIFVLEFPVVMAQKINRYISGGEGAPRELLGSPPMVFSTKEMLALVRWMRAFNQKHKEDPIQFWGFQPYQSEEAMRELSAYVAGLEAGPYRADLEELLSVIQRSFSASFPDAIPRSAPPTLSVRDACATIRDRISTVQGLEGRDERVRAALMIGIVQHSLRHKEPNAFEESSAANVASIAEAYPDARLIVWAHNGHIGDRSGALGGYLTDRFGHDYVKAFFTYFDGKVTLGGRAMESDPAAPGTLEWTLHRVGVPRMFLDLRACLQTALGDWLSCPIPARMMSAEKQPSGFFFTSMRAWDLLVFVDQASQSLPLE